MRRSFWRSIGSMGIAAAVALLMAALLVNPRSPAATGATLAAIFSGLWGWVIGAIYVMLRVEEKADEVLGRRG